MPRGPLQPVLHFLHALALRPLLREQSDGKLLEHFCASGDEAAFTVLVQRHGPMVLGACQRILHSPHEAEDCFQAVFLTLARKAPSIRKPEYLAGWLHGVARRSAGKARARLVRRMQSEQPLVDVAVAPEDDAVWRDLRPVLDEEIAGLPPQYRAAFVLCHLQSKTHAEAARQLGWPRATVATRLGWARQRLQRRLIRRGVTLPAGALATLLATRASPAALPAGLVGATVRAVLLAGVGKAAAGGTGAATIIHGVLRAMTMSKGQLAGLLLAVGVLGAGAGWLRGYLANRGQTEPPPSSQREDKVLEELTALRKDVQEMRAASAPAKPTGAASDAATALYHGKPAREWLLQFHDRERRYRTEAIKPLIELAVMDRSLIPELLAGLQDTTVALLIAEQLPECKPPAERAVPALLRSRVPMSVILHALKKIDPEGKVAMPAAMEALKAKEPRVRKQSVLAPCAYDKDKARLAIPALVEALKIWDEGLSFDHDNAPPAVEAARLLGQIGPEAREAIPALVEMLVTCPEAPSPRHRGPYNDLVHNPDRGIISVIHRVDPQGSQAVPALVEAVKKTKETNPRVASRMVWALARFGSEAKSAVPVLMSLWEKETPDVVDRSSEKPEDMLHYAVFAALTQIDPKAGEKASDLMLKNRVKEVLKPKSPR